MANDNADGFTGGTFDSSGNTNTTTNTDTSATPDPFTGGTFGGSTGDPQHFDPTTVTPVTGGGPQTTAPPPPIVPSRNGGGDGTTVNTPSLRLFASNVGMLEQPLRTALSSLQAMKPVAPGGFYQASQIRTKVNGEDGLQGKFSTVLTNVIEAVVDTRNAMLKLAGDYESTEDQNSMQTSALQRAMSDVNDDIGSIVPGSTSG